MISAQSKAIVSIGRGLARTFSFGWEKWCVKSRTIRPESPLHTCGVYGNVVRFLAPITIPDAHFAEAMDILEPV